MKKKSRKIAIFQKIKNCNFPRVFFHFFIIFPIFFIIFASSGAKILQEMENYTFPRVFFFHFFIICLNFLLPVVELMKNDKKMI